MVKVNFERLEQLYEEDIKSKVCGRQTCSVLILVACEIDAMVSTRMITHLLKKDNIAYAIIPIPDESQLKDITISSDIKCIILMNCGATINVMKTLRLAPSDDARCYVLDNKRPFHLANIYSRHKVAVFDDSDGDNDEDIPDDDGDLSLDSRSTDDDDLESHNEESLVDIDEDALDDASLSEVDDDVMEDGEIDDEIESVDDGDINDSHDEQLDIDATVNDNDESAELGGTDNPADPVINASFENNDLEVLGDDVEQNNLGRKRNANGDDLSDMGGDNDDGEEEEEKEEMLAPRKKQRIVNPVIVRRNELKRYYFQGNYVSVPTSVVVMKLVSSRVSASAPVDVMWQGAIGLCSQYEEGNISEDYYNEVCESVKMVLQDHLESSQTSSVYIQQVDGETDIAVPVAEAGNITEGLDYRFYLYRHWSLYESMLNSPYIMQKLSTWQSQGEIRLQEMLAKIGVSMEQAVQSYQFMTPTLRRHMSQQLGLESTKQEFGLQDPEVAFRSFFRHVSFRSAISTTDMVHAASALLDLCHFSLLSSPTTTDKMDDVVENLDNKGNRINNANAINDGQRVSVNEAFNEAYDCLGVKSEELLKKGIKAGIFIQKMLVKKAAALLENSDAIKRVEKLYYAYVYHQGHSTDTSSFVSDKTQDELDLPLLFYRPNSLSKIGNLVMSIKMNQKKLDGGWKGKRTMPLFLLSEQRDTVLVAGVSPLRVLSGSVIIFSVDEDHLEVLRKLSNFNLFFSLAAKEMKVPIKLNFGLNPNVCEISKLHAHAFLGTLNYLFKKATV